MSHESQEELFSNATDPELARVLIADLHNDLLGKVSRFHQLQDLSLALGEAGTMMPGGEVVLAGWLEARASFTHGNFLTTVLVCQSMAEHNGRPQQVVDY